MANNSRDRRGAYAKGVAKREEILERTLEVIATEGYRGASVKELAEAVGLTQAGLLYHFGTKEELFAEILRKRDEVSARCFPIDPGVIQDSYLNTIKHNAGVPGLVELFSQMAVAAADPSHPSHRFFVQHGETLRGAFIQCIEQNRKQGDYGRGLPPEVLARMLQAVTDGMQLQWLLDPTVDMAEVVRALFTLLENPSD